MSPKNAAGIGKSNGFVFVVDTMAAPSLTKSKISNCFLLQPRINLNRFLITIHLLNLCDCVVNSQRLLCSQKLIFVSMISGIKRFFFSFFR